MAKKRGISEAKLALYNLLQREKFRAVPPGERILFLPHCLRKPKGCRGENTEEGLVCKHCTPGCHINSLSTYAVSKGYRCFVAPGGGMVFNLVEKYRPRAIIGVACHHEIGQAADRIVGKESSFNFAYQGVLLSKDGCVDTQVDESAVREVIDLQGPPPRGGPSSMATSHVPRLAVFKRLGGIAAASAAVLVALFLLVPPILAPASQQGTKGAPEISFLSKPTATYSRDGDGNYWAEVHTSVYNNGPAPAAGVLVQATSFYCGNKYEPMNGGIQHFTVNGTIGAGHRADVELQLRVHGLNDTSITIETLIHNRVQLIGYIKSPKPAFLSNVGVTGYVTGLASGREANLSVSVFNDGKAVYAAGSLRVVATSYSPFSTRIESSETVLDRSLPTNSTWTYSVLLKVNELDLGHPFFMVELYNRGGSSPADAVTVDG